MSEHAEIERPIDKAAQRERDRRIARSIARDWSRAGYYPGKHLIGLQVAGESLVLMNFNTMETMLPKPGTDRLASWMARMDMYEIDNARRAMEKRR